MTQFEMIYKSNIMSLCLFGFESPTSPSIFKKEKEKKKEKQRHKNCHKYRYCIHSIFLDELFVLECLQRFQFALHHFSKFDDKFIVNKTTLLQNQ